MDMDRLNCLETITEYDMFRMYELCAAVDNRYTGRLSGYLRPWGLRSLAKILWSFGEV